MTPPDLWRTMRHSMSSRVRHLLPKRARPALAAVVDLASETRLQVSERRGLRFGRQMEMVAGPVGSSRDSSNPLESYFDDHTTGPGIWKWRHYFDIYHRHLAKFIGREVHVVEIGVFSGGSLGMWFHYFGAKCRVYGVDIEPACKAYETESVRIFVGDQADPEFWRAFIETVPQIDVVVDDGGHRPDQQIASFESVFSHISPGGVYLCEDVHGVHNEFHRYICGLSRNMNAYEGPTAFQSTVDSVHLYPFVAVVERPDRPLSEMKAERHGTEWQPFL